MLPSENAFDNLKIEVNVNTGGDSGNESSGGYSDNVPTVERNTDYDMEGGSGNVGNVYDAKEENNNEIEKKEIDESFYETSNETSNERHEYNPEEMDQSKEEASQRMGQTKVEDITDSATEQKLNRLTSNSAKDIINKSGTENRTDTFSDKESLDNKDKALMFGTSGVMLNDAGLKSEINTFVSKHEVGGEDSVDFTGDNTDRIRGNVDEVIDQTSEKIVEEAEKLGQEAKELIEKELTEAKDLLENEAKDLLEKEEREILSEINDVVSGRKSLAQVSAKAMQRLSI